MATRRRKPRERRKRGSGSVYFLKAEGVWIASMPTNVRDARGRRKRILARFHDEDAAWDELERMERSVAAGANPATMTLDEYLESWLRSYAPSVRASTIASYTNHVRLHIRPLLGGIKVSALRPDDVRRLITDRLAAGKAPATVVRICTTLSIAMGQAYSDRIIPDNPCSGVRLPKVEPPPIQAMTSAEVKAIKGAVRGDPLEAFYLLLLGAGLRNGEACGLDWSDVNLERRFVRIRVSKTEVRAVSIPVYTAEALTEHKARSKRTGQHDPVFVGPRNGERLMRWTPDHAFPRLLERAGIRRMRPHDLRHGTATRMLSRGVPMRIIADQLGHKSQTTTRRYVHVIPDELVSAVDRLDEDMLPEMVQTGS